MVERTRLNVTFYVLCLSRCLVQRHEASTQLRPPVTVLHPLNYAAQCRRTNKDKMLHATKLHACPSEWLPLCVQCWLLSSRNFVIHFDLVRHVVSTRSKRAFASGDVLAAQHTIAVNFHVLSMCIGCKQFLYPEMSIIPRKSEDTVSHVGRACELQKHCSFFARASSHRTVITKFLCHVHQDYFKFKRVGSL
jgi:hypothetical protein